MGASSSTCESVVAAVAVVQSVAVLTKYTSEYGRELRLKWQAVFPVFCCTASARVFCKSPERLVMLERNFIVAIALLITGSATTVMINPTPMTISSSGNEKPACSLLEGTSDIAFTPSSAIVCWCHRDASGNSVEFRADGPVNL